MKGVTVFEYGGYHYIPERKLSPEENDFAKINRNLKIDVELGFCKPNYAYSSKYPYSYEAFYASASDKTCDLYRCVENGRLYMPCGNDLQEYVESAVKEQENAVDADPGIYERLNIPEVSPLDMINDITIGDRTIVVGRVKGGQYSGKYMCAYRHLGKYTDVILSSDYFDILDVFSQHIQEQADRTRIAVTAPFFDGFALEPIGTDGCKPLSEDDTLIGEVVVIRADVLRPEYQTATCQLRLCEGGFGAYPHSRGSACFCKNLLTGEEGRFERDEILGTIAPDMLPGWARQRLESIQREQKKQKHRDREAR